MSCSLPVYAVREHLIFRPNEEFVNSIVSASTQTAEYEVTDLIFLVDSSGSMSYIWPSVAENVNRVKQTRPRTHVLKWANHGHVRRAELLMDSRMCESVDQEEGTSVGFGTNITAAAEILHEHLLELRRSGRRRFTVVLVSDGQGSTENLIEVCEEIRASCLEASVPCEEQPDSASTSSTGAVLEFTTVGVGSDFPTAIAMSIRNVLHNGRASVPLVSLVDDVEDVGGALEGLKEFLEPHTLSFAVLDPPVCTSPWPSSVSAIEQDTVYVVPKGTSFLKLLSAAVEENGSSVSGAKPLTCALVEHPWTPAILCATGRQWMWTLQSLSMRNAVERETIKSRAEVVLQLIYEAHQSISEYLLEEERAILKASVLERLTRKRTRSTQIVLNGLCKELRTLADGTLLDGLTDEEMAQRLAIGTVEGKYHQRALRWKGIGSADFLRLRSKFVDLLGDPEMLDAISQQASSESSEGLRSAISLESNSDILCQPGLREAISQIPSQYFLLDVLPLVGLAVHVIRSNASMINPWATQVRNLAVHTPVLDTLSLIAFNSQQSFDAGISVSLSAGDNQREVLNSVCCVVASKDHAAAVRPFLTSGLYRVLHTYCTCGNVDMLENAAHLALLAAVLCHMLDEKARGRRRQDWFDLVLLTIRELYPSYSPAKEGFLKALTLDPALTLVTESQMSTTKCESTSKVIGLCLPWKDAIPLSRRTAIVEHLCKEWFGRAIGARRGIADWFELENVDISFTGVGQSQAVVDLDNLTADMMRSVLSYETTVDIAHSVRKRFRSIVSHGRYDAVVMKESCIRDPKRTKDGGVTFCALTEFCKDFLEDPAWRLSSSDLKRFCYFATQRCSSLDRQENAPRVSDDEIGAALLAPMLRTAVAEARSKLLQTVVDAWHQRMSVYHKFVDVQPMSWDRIVSESSARGIADLSPEVVGFREEVGLCRHACMAPQCPFFLKPTRAAGLHYNEAANLSRGIIPAFAVAVASCVERRIFDPKAIFEEVLSGQHMKYNDRKKLESLPSLLMDRKPEALELIERHVDCYRTMKCI